MQMKEIDELCRLCAQQLDISISKNIFAPENKNLLTVILQSIPISVERDDCYPKYVCIHCVFKLEVLLELNHQSLSSVRVFNGILEKRENKNPETGLNLSEVKQEESFEFVLYEEPESKFDSSRDLENKITIDSKDEQRAEPVDKTIGCVILKAHSPTKDKRFHCEECNQSFSRQFHLKRHKSRHTGQKPYNCKFCAKSFRVLSSLNRHQITHNRESTFQCKKCPKRFSDRSNLLRHLNIHEGLKPFKCEHCEKAFNDPSTLIVHNRSHTGIKPYKCNNCDAKFSRISSLTKHKRRHTGEKPYQCQECFQRFTAKHSLNNHQKTKHVKE